MNINCSPISENQNNEAISSDRSLQVKNDDEPAKDQELPEKYKRRSTVYSRKWSSFNMIVESEELKQIIKKESSHLQLNK